MITTKIALALLLAAPPAQGRFGDEVRVGAPVAAENLTVFPLLLRHAAVGAEELTLDEAVR